MISHMMYVKHVQTVNTDRNSNILHTGSLTAILLFSVSDIYIFMLKRWTLESKSPLDGTLGLSFSGLIKYKEHKEKDFTSHPLGVSPHLKNVHVNICVHIYIYIHTRIDICICPVNLVCILFCFTQTETGGSTNTSINPYLCLSVRQF